MNHKQRTFKASYTFEQYPWVVCKAHSHQFFLLLVMAAWTQCRPGHQTLWNPLISLSFWDTVVIQLNLDFIVIKGFPDRYIQYAYVWLCCDPRTVYNSSVHLQPLDSVQVLLSPQDLAVHQQGEDQSQNLSKENTIGHNECRIFKTYYVVLLFRWGFDTVSNINSVFQYKLNSTVITLFIHSLNTYNVSL